MNAFDTVPADATLYDFGCTVKGKRAGLLVWLTGDGFTFVVARNGKPFGTPMTNATTGDAQREKAIAAIVDRAKARTLATCTG